MENLPVKKEATMFFDIAKFEFAQRVARVFSESTMVPEQFQGNLGNCLIALNYADRLGADPFMLMQGMCVVHGKPGLEGKLIIGMINSCGRFEPIEFEVDGNLSKCEDDSHGCTAVAKELRSGKTLRGPKIDWYMVKSEGWYGKNGSKWKTGLAPLMFRYRAAAYFGRVYCPDVLLGMQTREELVDVVEMERAGGRYVQADDPPKRIEKPVYVVHQAKDARPVEDHREESGNDTRAEAERLVEGLPEHAPEQEAGPQPADPNTTTAWRVGDMAFYKLGQGIGWKQVRVMGLGGDVATIEFAEDYEHSGKQMRGVVAKKPVSDLRRAIPQPLTREEFINMKSNFTPEFLESVRERVEETKDAKVIADLIYKAKKFFGEDYKVPGLPPAPDEPPVEEPEQEAREVPTAGEARIGDDPERNAIKHINALINERGMEKAGVKLAMKRFVLHLKGESPIHPFDVESTNDIQVQHVRHFDEMLSEIQPQHNIMMMILDYEKRVKGIGEYVKQKMSEWDNPPEVAHWYMLPPNAVNKIKLNLDDWAKELLTMQDGGEEKF